MISRRASTPPPGTLSPTSSKSSRRAALATGVPPDRLGSHSLRIGGACAIYHHCKDLEKVRRFGRWATAVFHVYLWETAGDSTGMAEGMARPQGVLLAARGLGAQATGGIAQPPNGG